MSDEPELINPNEDASLRRRLGTSGTMLVLFYDHWFAAFCVVLLLSGIFLGLFLPRIWLQTPEDLTPAIKVSGLDLWQARSLRRAANQHLAAGRFNDAVIAWSSAIANNAGDPVVIREALQALVAQPQLSKDHLGFGVGRAMWLLRLSKTNLADLELTLAVLGRYDLDSYVVSMGAPYRDRVSASAKIRLERAYFDTGKYREFGEFWEPNAAVFEKDPELALFRDAWICIAGKTGNPLAAQEALSKARTDPARRLLANRLQLSVAYARQDPAAYTEALRQLEDEHVDKLGQHVFQWMLLYSVGRKDEAQEMARNFNRPPVTPAETALAAQGYHVVGLAENSIAYLEQHVPRFPFEPELWILHSNYLIEAKRWADLRTVALAMRSETSLESQLDAYSYFAEAIAESRLDRPEMAANAADRVARSAIPSASLAREMARTLRAEGFAKTAVDILRPLKESMKDNPDFWFEYSVAAFSANADEEIVPAARRSFELRPTDLSAVNNYAAALIAFRRESEKSVDLSARVLASRPNDIESMLNHILALIQASREEEAEKMLRGLNTLSFRPAESSVFYLCWFELNVRRKQWAEARASYGRIDPHQLLAVQARWLDETFRTIPQGS